MPVTIANLFRLMVLLGLALHVFVMYTLARTMGEQFGFSIGTLIVSSLFALVMLVPLIWAVSIPELPDIYRRMIRGRQWYNEGRCPECGYDLRGRGAASASERKREESTCPECGREAGPPEPYRLRPTIIAQYALLNVLALVLGAAGGESWVQADERAFVHEAQAQLTASSSNVYIRNRVWPMAFREMAYIRDFGVVTFSEYRDYMESNGPAH